MKRTVLGLLTILLLLSLSACKSEPESKEAKESKYILTNYTALPESVTNISKCFLDGDRLFLCCWEEEDEENAAYYAATLSTDGSGFEKLPLDLTGAGILLDITPDGNGGLWGLCMAPNGDGTAGYSLRRFDKGGGTTAEVPLTELFEKAGASRSGKTVYLTADGSGNLCVTARYGRTFCFLFDRDGGFLFSLKDGGNPKTVVTTASGQLAVCSTTDGDWTYSLLPIDMDRQDWGERISIGTTSNVFSGSGSADYYLYDSSDLYSCQIGTGAKDRLFNWSNLGLAGGDTHVCPLSGGRFAVVAGSYDQTQLLSYEFCVAEPGEDDRTVLTMLSLQPEDSLLEAVAQFNKSSDKYRVELTSYFSRSEDPSGNDWTNAVTKLNTELISGKVPDLMDLNYLPADAYSRQGILEDLFPYLQNDPDIRMEDYFENVFTALSIDGKLPYITSSVSIYTMFADSDAVGTERGWTVADYAGLKESGVITVEGLQPQRFLRLLVGADNWFVDWERGECRFDSDEFISLLELCKSMEDSETGGQFIPGVTSEDRYANCMYAPVFSVLTVSEYNARLSGNANPIGFPNGSGEVMHILSPANKIGFSTTCAHKDGAWEFVRSFLKPKLQESGWFFPYLKSSFEKITAAAAKGHGIEASMFTGKVSEKDIELTRELLSTASYCGNSDQGLTDLIVEMAQSYFSGDKTAQKVAADLQQRAHLYIGEHR